MESVIIDDIMVFHHVVLLSYMLIMSSIACSLQCTLRKQLLCVLCTSDLKWLTTMTSAVSILWYPLDDVAWL